MTTGWPDALAGRDNVLVDGRTGGRTTWVEVSPAPLERPTAVLVRPPTGAVAALAWVAAHARTGTGLLLAPAARASGDSRAELVEAGLAVVEPGTGDADHDLDEPAAHDLATGGPAADRVWLLTSGSTGRPTRVAHTLASLTTVASAPAPQRWLCAYPPGSYAWWQLVTLSLTHAGQDLVLVDPGDHAALDRWPSTAADHGVTAVSGTPTFWRRALLSDPAGLARLPLRQVTLGGEPVDQAVLDRLTELFPQARVSWIYASSELGAVVVVHDGRAGFPADWLDQPERPVGLRVEDGELVVRSPHRADGQDTWTRTGDRVEVVGDRVLVVGRTGSDEVNVGGVKVSAGVVRETLLRHPQVRWARVFGRRAPVVGALVCAEVVLADPAAEHGLRAWCTERLPEAAVPRRVRVLESIPVKESLKSDVG